jgi:hypothetical protein
MNKTVEQSQEIEENSQLKYILSRVILKIWVERSAENTQSFMTAGP